MSKCLIINQCCQCFDYLQHLASNNFHQITVINYQLYHNEICTVGDFTSHNLQSLMQEWNSRCQMQLRPSQNISLKIQL